MKPPDTHATHAWTSTDGIMHKLSDLHHGETPHFYQIWVYIWFYQSHMAHSRKVRPFRFVKVAYHMWAFCRQKLHISFQKHVLYPITQGVKIVTSIIKLLQCEFTEISKKTNVNVCKKCQPNGLTFWAYTYIYNVYLSECYGTKMYLIRCKQRRGYKTISGSF